MQNPKEHRGKGEIACYKQFLLFSQYFQKTYDALTLKVAF